MEIVYVTLVAKCTGGRRFVVAMLTENSTPPTRTNPGTLKQSKRWSPPIRTGDHNRLLRPGKLQAKCH
jgi:hypothetical protein